MRSREHAESLRQLVITGLLILSFMVACLPTPAPANTNNPIFIPRATNIDITGGTALVFVSRAIPADGSIYYDPARGMAGVGPQSRFIVAAPGKLLVHEPGGRIRVLIDGSNPGSNAFNLIDVNAPDVSYDGSTIVFAGISAQYNTANNRKPRQNPGGWRIYTIKADGSGLRQVTTSDQQLNLAQFGGAAGGLAAYDDTDPIWLPDGRIVFSSTRWPSFAQYDGVRTTNLYVVNANGSGMRRITSERNGADRPLVDPKTGQIVYSRWWRNHRFALNSMASVASGQVQGQAGFTQRDGLSANRAVQMDGGGEYNDFLWRNAWQTTAINPDGTGLAMWAGSLRNEEANHTYGGTFAPNGDLIANFFPMFNMSEAAGFGGIRRYPRGASGYTALLGVATMTLDYVNKSNPTSFGIFKGPYAAEPEYLPNDRLVVSYARDINQDYGLAIVQPDGRNLRMLYDNPGTAELRARALRPRPLPPIIQDRITQVASLLPPDADGPYDIDGTFVFDALNVYFNAPVDTDIVSAPPVGSAQSIRFFIDHQRTSPGSFPQLDWPILLAEMAVSPAGAVTNPNAPANVPLFEQLRAPDGSVPFTFSSRGEDGAAHVAGMNFGRPGEEVRCVGCHAGHSMIPTPESDEAALWSNLAPGAALTVSSALDPKYINGLTDRRVMKGEVWRYWRSAAGQTNGQWVKLSFGVPITVRTVRLYNPRRQSGTDLQVTSAVVRLYNSPSSTTPIASFTVGELSSLGTDVAIGDLQARVIQVEITGVNGRVDNVECASLAEIEVIARGEAP